MDQGATWYGGRPRPRPHCVRWRPSSRSKKGHTPIFTHVCCGQTAGWIKLLLGTEVALGPGDIVLDGDPAPPRKGTQQPPHVSAHVCCGQTAGCIRIPLGADVGRGPGDIVFDGAQFPLPKRGTSPPIFGPCLLCPNCRPSQLLLGSC